MEDCTKCNEYEVRLTALEKDLSGFGKRVTDLDKDFAVSKTSITQSIENLSKLPETLDSMNQSMLALQRSLDDNNRKTDGFGEDITELREEVRKIDGKVDDINEEGKVNVRRYIRDNWAALLIGIGGIFVACSQFIK